MTRFPGFFALNKEYMWTTEPRKNLTVDWFYCSIGVAVILQDSPQSIDMNAWIGKPVLDNMAEGKGYRVYKFSLVTSIKNEMGKHKESLNRKL